MKHLRPDVLVFGPGPWMRNVDERSAEDKDRVRRLLTDLKSTLAPRGRAIFRTCPRGSKQVGKTRGCTNGPGCDEVFRALLDEAGWEIFDLFQVTDQLHGYMETTCLAEDARLRAAHQRGSGAQLMGHRPATPIIFRPKEGPLCSQAYHRIFADNAHFSCALYREFNRLLLAGL